MIQDGFKFNLKVVPVVTGKAAKIRFELDSISLMGWNSDGSARTSKSGTATTVQIGYEPQEFVIGGLRKSESVRGNAGLPFFKDLPIIGRLFSTETESIKQSQLVLIARVELSTPDDKMGAEVQEEVGKIVKQVNKGVNSPIGNMLFQQYLLDEDRPDREKRLDKLSDKINDKYQEHK
jgi:general secretion pathway protein D